jgi:hypothetical protein
MKYQIYRSLFILGAGALMALMAFAGHSGFETDTLLFESQAQKQAINLGATGYPVANNASTQNAL